MKMKKRILFCLAALTSFSMFSADITLAENGEAKAVIVIPEPAKPIVKLAAKELADHLKKMTGAEFVIAGEAGDKTGIFLGFGETEDFAPDEFVIRAKGNRIDIYGKDTGRKHDLFNYFYDNPDKGTLRGVYNFLDSLGVRWLAPGEDGAHIPRLSVLRIPEQEIRYKPHFRDRQIADAWSFLKFPDAKEYVENVGEVFLWGLRNNVSTRNMVNGCHSEYSLKLFENPEWLAHPSAHRMAKDGTRDPRHSCWTDPFTKEIWLRAVDGCFSGKTPQECGFELKGYLHSRWPNPFISPDEFMIDPMDHSGGNDGRCYCERCNAFRKEHPCADDTELIWQVLGDIARHVEEKYPGRCISTLIYPPKKQLPQTIEKPKNIRVRICMIGPRDLEYPAQMEKDMKLLKDWGDFLGPENIPLWIYQCATAFGNYMPGVPDLYPHLTAKFIETVRPLCAGMFQENHNVTHTYRNLDLYIFLRLMWDPDRNVEKELDEYYTLYYGPAAVPAKELFTRLENDWLKLDPLVFGDPKNPEIVGAVRGNAEDARKLAWGRVYTAEEMKILDGLVQEMLRLSPSDSVYAKRARLLQTYLIRVMESERSDVMEKEERRQKLNLAVPKTADAVPSEEEWNRSPVYELGRAQKLAPELKAAGSFRLLASDNTLFIRAELKEPKMFESKTDPAHASGNIDIWKDNCIELFFYAEKSRKFWQVIVNDNNAWSSQTRGRVLNRWEQMVGLKAATVRNADGWTAEIAVPLKELGTDKTDLRFNLARERNIKGQPTEYSTWSPLATLGNWHSPDNYGTLTFGSEK
ncbi:MAG: DUF4838 domain-containing protein [Lentisphaeria bacterium]|nr:DUF4838 domain-containing protein [Lentisphaeria bacterium]